MAAERGNGLPGRPVGRFIVSVSRNDAEGFRAALTPEGPRVRRESIPLSFPIAWLGREDVRTALRRGLNALAGRPGHLPVHVSQSIAYQGPLVFDRSYWLDVSLAGPDARGGIGLEVAVRNSDETLVVRLSGVLAMVPTAAKP